MTRRTLGIVGCCGVLRQWDRGGNNKSIMLKMLDQITRYRRFRGELNVRLGAVSDLSF